MKKFAALMLLASLFSTPSLADTEISPEYQARVERSGDNKTLRAYYCPGSRTAGNNDRLDVDRLMYAMDRLSKAGANEAAVAKSIKCERWDSATTYFSIEEMVAGPVRTADSEWSVAYLDVGMRGATGVTFYGVMRLPFAGAGAGSAASAKADSDFIRLYGARTMTAEGDENGTYFLCASAQAANNAIERLALKPETTRDEYADHILGAAGCRSGASTITGIKAQRVIGKEYTHWYSGTALMRGKPVNVVMGITN